VFFDFGEFVPKIVYGGSFMTKDIIQEIKQAELNAAMIEKNTNEKHDEMINNAESESKKIIASALGEVKKTIAAKSERAESEEKEIIQASVNEAEQEIIALKEIFKEKEDSAVKLVLSEII